MAKKSECSMVSAAAWIMCKFLGALMLLNGLKMLMDYSGTTSFMMGVGSNMSFEGGLGMVAEYVSMAVAYTWPLVSVLVGASLLTCYKKCIAVTTLAVYLLLFTAAHVWTGDMVGAIWDVLFVIYIGQMMSYMEGCKK